MISSTYNKGLQMVVDQIMLMQLSDGSVMLLENYVL